MASVPARVVIWPSTPTVPASGTNAGNSPLTPFTIGRSSGTYRRQQPTGNPPWQPASPPKTPGALPEMLPAETTAEAAGQPLPPWEQSPTDFAAAPATDDPALWPVSNTGPMYVWNPAATTGPLSVVNDYEEEE